MPAVLLRGNGPLGADVGQGEASGQAALWAALPSHMRAPECPMRGERAGLGICDLLPRQVAAAALWSVTGLGTVSAAPDRGPRREMSVLLGG